MKNLTWNDLLTRLQEMSAKELFDNATVYDNTWDEFFPVDSRFGVSQSGDAADGLLDEGHLYLRIGDFEASPHPRSDEVQACLTDLRSLVEARGSAICAKAIEVITALQKQIKEQG